MERPRSGKRRLHTEKSGGEYAASRYRGTGKSGIGTMDKKVQKVAQRGNLNTGAEPPTSHLKAWRRLARPLRLLPRPSSSFSS